MADQKVLTVKKRAFSLTTFVLMLLPLAILGGVILIFLNTAGGLDLSSPAPVESITFERTQLRPGSIDIHIRNSGPDEVAIAQVIINDAIWPAQVTPNPVPRLGKAIVHLDYPWSQEEAYELALFTTNAIAFEVEIPVAFTTPQPDWRTFWSFTLIGIYVGVIPVYLGMLWFPALRQLERRWMMFLLAITAGLLVFLGLDTLVEAVEQASRVPGPLQGIGLAGTGAVGAFLLLEAISRRQAVAGRSEAAQRLGLAYLIATGIGLHNLGEGLAIGAAYNVGEVALGTFLVVGFIIQNVTEGLGIIAPVLRERPGLGNLALLGLVGGTPAIFGAWLGGFAPSPTLAVLFLGLGTGAIFQVAYEIAKLIQKEPAPRAAPGLVFSGVIGGMLILWVTGLLIK